MPEFLFNKVAGLRLWYECFLVNFVKFLRTPFFIEYLWWLLLQIYRREVISDFFYPFKPFSILKLVSANFYQIFISHQMIALQNLRKMLFISPKKLFSFSRYSNFCISIFPSFSPCQPLL